MGCMEWGGDTGGSGAYSYPSARSPTPRSYDSTPSSSVSKKSIKNIDDLVPQSLETKSESPLVVACDVTGSMQEWPKIIFDKLPLLYGELKKAYFKDKNPEISFAAIGDAYCDQYPLQVQKFDSDKSLDDRLGALILEGGGGGQIYESYELAALYYARNVKMENATKPIFIFIGDEGVYNSINNDQAAAWARININERLTTKQVIGELMQKYSVYLVRKLYDEGSGDNMGDNDKEIQKQWKGLLGPNRVAILPQPERIVDVILGIVANDTGMTAYFDKELTQRQTPDQVKTVMKTLKAVTQPKALTKGQSVMTKKKSKEKDADPLI